MYSFYDCHLVDEGFEADIHNFLKDCIRILCMFFYLPYFSLLLRRQQNDSLETHGVPPFNLIFDPDLPFASHLHAHVIKVQSAGLTPLVIQFSLEYHPQKILLQSNTRSQP